MIYNVHIISNFDGFFYVNSQKKNIPIPREIFEKILLTGDQKAVLREWNAQTETKIMKKKIMKKKINTQLSAEF